MKTPEEVMAAAVTEARESCLLSRSELGRELAEVGLPPSSAWRWDTRGRVSADEQAQLAAVLTNRREDLTRKATAAQAAIDALGKITPTLTTEPDEPEPEPTPKAPTKRAAKATATKATPKKTAPKPGPRRSATPKAAVTE